MTELYRIGTDGSPLDRIGRQVTQDTFQAALRSPAGRWLVLSSDWLPQVLVDVRAQRARHHLLLLQQQQEWFEELLKAAFRTVLTRVGLPRDQLADVLRDKHPENFFIGGLVLPEAVLLYRGNFDRLVIPRTWFLPSGTAAPDFDDFEVIDYGQTIRLGRYEAATDALLYDFDATARRRMRKHALDQDRSLGAAIRRLRLQRKLSRDDFDVTAKTIARIERGEVEPHTKTLAILAKRLGVKPDELSTY